MGAYPRHMERTLAVVLLGCALAAATTPKPDGTCGYQCTADSECGGCGTAGKCSCPDEGTKFPTISCSCVSAPANSPTSPEVDVADSVWPSKWTANVSAWSYGDFSDKTAQAQGKFYYDEDSGSTRGEWTPYINGKDATQVWITSPGSSKYYVKSGPLCIYFPITDPGQNKAPIGVERKDWMQWCNTSGFAQYMGREQVQGEWADHWSCHIEYPQANQSITFQNWHSLGLAKLPKGLPLRVTGGNSAPNPTKGSPRLNTVWYSDFITGNASVSPEDFKKPSWLCIPVMLQPAQVKEFFGYLPTVSHAISGQIANRAHWLPHARLYSKDVLRARSKPAYMLGNNFAGAMTMLNQALSSDQAVHTKDCADFTISELHQVQRVLMNAAAPALNEIYKQRNDTRALRVMGDADLNAEFRAVALLVAARPELFAMVRDGLCHETIMMYTHHLSNSARAEAAHLVALPLMPAVLHSVGDEQDAAAVDAHKTYTAQVSCAVCHVK